MKFEPVVYQCAVCGTEFEAKSAKMRHRPEGYYIAVRRVTESLNHHATVGEVFTCDKVCAVDFMQYKLSENFEPQGRVK
jgi:hypothetical protein